MENRKELLTIWLADKVLDTVEGEDEVKRDAVLFSSCEEPSIRKVKAFYVLQKVRHSSGTFRDTMSYNSCCSLSICKITDFLRCVFGVW